MMPVSLNKQHEYTAVPIPNWVKYKYIGLSPEEIEAKYIKCNLFGIAKDIFKEVDKKIRIIIQHDDYTERVSRSKRNSENQSDEERLAWRLYRNNLCEFGVHYRAFFAGKLVEASQYWRQVEKESNKNIKEDLKIYDLTYKSQGMAIKSY